MPVLRSPLRPVSIYTHRRIFFCLLLLFGLSAFAQAQEQENAPDTPATELNVEDLRRRITGEAPLELIGLTLGDTDVSLFMTGFWAGTLQGNLGFANDPLGTRLISPETPVLFTQEADLTLSLWIRERWFVEVNFLDNTSLNTYRAGYQGLPGEYVQYAGIGNTGLDFPVFPYLDLGGDSPSSFGFYSRLGSQDLSVHTLFRYDAAAREERVFVGGRERTYSYVEPQNSVRGISFVLPDINIDSDPLVYIEDENGSLRDNNGRRWRLAGSSEYAAGRNMGLMELNVRPQGMVAVSYSRGADNRPWNTSMGYYDNPGVPGISDFLYIIQQWFDPSMTNIKLEDFPQSGNGRGLSSRPGEVIINGLPALVLREAGTFSPFERQNRYEAPSSFSEQAALVYLSSGKEFAGYELVPLDAGALNADIPLYSAAERNRNFYELLIAGKGADRRTPETRWPLAELYPQAYMPGSTAFTGDLSLRFTNYGSSLSYLIGTDVVPGSVLVWRSGIQDPNFTYDAYGGTVSLATPAGNSELIRITYLKRSDETRLGSIAAGLGAIYNREHSPFSSAIALGIRWNLTADNSYTEEGVSSPGTVGLSAKTAWDFDHLKTQITAGVGFEQTDTTGLYRVEGMEGNEATLSLSPESAFISHPPESADIITPNFTGLTVSNRADLVYRNYRDNAAFGSTLMPITWGGSSTVSGQNRPYPAKDPRLGSDTQVLVAEFSLSNARNWTGFQVPLGDNSAILSRAGEIEIPYRLYGFNNVSVSDFKLILQIGSLSGEDNAIRENLELILEKELFSAAAGINENPRIARFVISDEERLRLTDVKFLRLLAVYGGTGTIQGRVLLAPPIVRSAGFRAVTYDGNTVKGSSDLYGSGTNAVRAVQIYETGASSLGSAYSETINRLHPIGGRQRVLEIGWEGMQQNISAGADGRVGDLPLFNYSTLSFFVKGPAISPAGRNLIFYIAPGSEALSDYTLMAEIPLGAFRSGQWSKVTINYRGDNQGITVDGGNAAPAVLRYRPSTRLSQENAGSGRTNYVAFLITPQNGTSLDDGSICIDEIILEDASPVYRLNFGMAAEYSRQGNLLSIGNMPVFSDLLVSNALESETRGDPFTGDEEVSAGMVNRSRAEISVFDTELTGNFAFTAAKETFLWSAGHGVSRSWGPFSAGESFFTSPGENSAGHKINLAFTNDFSANLDAEASFDFSKLARKWDLDMGYKNANVYIPSTAVTARAIWTDNNEEIEENASYGWVWLRSLQELAPDAGTGADLRQTVTKISVTEATVPVGATVTFDGSTNYVKANNQLSSESGAGLDVPVFLGQTSLLFNMGRRYKRSLWISSDDALNDGNKFFESVNDSLQLWTVFPFYSLFTPELDKAMDRSIEDSPSFGITDYTVFYDRFGSSLRLPSHFDIKALVIPSGAGLRLERMLEQKLDTRFDMLTVGGNLVYSAINLFGLLGYYPLFKFYQGDEFSHAMDVVVALPKNEDLSWRFQSTAAAGFHGFSGGILSFGNTLTLLSGGGWLESLKIDWTVPTQKSLLSVFYTWVANAARRQSSWLTLSALLDSDYEQFRKESLELSFDNSGDYLYWTLSVAHESIIRILGRLNFSVFAKLDLSKESQTSTFSFAGTVGTSLRLSF
ncbi:MAG: hypothetical protein FWG99_01100 [Treponema sp.]|nr:hypothetical protein [Treponema sp.]